VGNPEGFPADELTAHDLADPIEGPNAVVLVGVAVGW
jgi:hypothetical protein